MLWLTPIATLSRDRTASNQSISQRPHCDISSARLPRHPAVAYLFLVRRICRMDITKHFDAAMRWSWKTALWSLVAVPVWLLLWFLLGFTWSDPPERFHLFVSAVL